MTHAFRKNVEGRQRRRFYRRLVGRSVKVRGQAFGMALLLGLTVLGLVGCGGLDDQVAAYETPDRLVFRTVSPPMPTAEVTLASVEGDQSTASLFEGQWTLLYFGYTYCPDVCPVEMGELARVARMLRESGADFDWQIVFVSVDPDRDSPEHLATYVEYFDPAVVGVTGAPEAIRALADSVRADYRIDEASRGEVGGQQYYLVDHDTSFRLIAPDGRMVGVFPSPHEAPVMTPVLESFVEEVSG